MDADTVIARACGQMLSRGVPAADVLKAEAQLRGLSQRSGGPLTIEMHGLRIVLPRFAGRPPVARRETRA